MGEFAWVTLATNDSYSLGALVLAHSLKQVGTKYNLVVLITPGVTKSMRDKLSNVFNLVKEVNILDSKDESNLRLLKRPELGVTFTKLHCWRLTQFDKCVFLDADTLVLKNCDELFERDELSAAPDVGWPDCFNSGVFVYKPSIETYGKLIDFALEKGSFDGGDQGLLNLYFADWATKDINKHLPFIYNMCSTACYSYLPAFKQFGADAKIIHFIGSTKPWLQYFNTETRKVQPSADTVHLGNILQHWWNIFCTLIHPNLTADMSRSSTDLRQTKQPSSLNPFNLNDKNIPIPNYLSNQILPVDIWDPWDSYPLLLPSPSSTSNDFSQIENANNDNLKESPNPAHHHANQPSDIKPIHSHNTNAINIADHHDNKCDEIPFSMTPNLVDHDPPESTVEINQSTNNDNVSQLVDVLIESSHTNNLPNDNNFPNPAINKTNLTDFEIHSPSVCIESPLLHTPEDNSNITNDSGLAGAFAQLTLGVPRTAEQNALDNQLRRQEWEIGNIDYMGKDSFDNIWTKICETLSTTPSNVVESPTPVAPVQQQDTSISVATKGESTPALQTQAESAPAADSLVQASLPSSQESAKPEQPLSVVEQKVEESKVDTKCQLEKQQGEVKPIETQLQTPPVTSTAPSESATTAQIVEVAQTKQEQGDAAKQAVQIAEKPVQTAEKPVEKIEEVAKPATVALPEAAPTSPVVEVAQPKPELIQPTEKPVEKTAEVVKPASVSSPEPALASPIVEVAPTKQEQASDAVKAQPTPTTEKPVEKTEEVAKPTIVAASEAAPTSPIAEVAQTKQEVIKPAEKPVEKSEEVAKPAAIVAASEAAPTAPVAEVAQTIPEPAGDTAKPSVQATEKPVEKTEDVAKPINVPQPTGEVVEPKPAAKKEDTVQAEGNVTKSEPAKGLPAPESCPVPPKSKSDQDQTPIAAAEEPKTLSKEEGPKTPSKEEVPQATNVQPTPPPRKSSGGGKKGGKSKK